MDHRHGRAPTMDRSAGALRRSASSIGDLDDRHRRAVAGDEANPFRAVGKTAA